MKKVFALILCFSMILSSILCVPFIASAANNVLYSNEFESALVTTTVWPSAAGWYVQSGNVTVDSDESVMKLTSSTATASTADLVRFYTPFVDKSSVAQADRKNLVIEFRVKFPATTGDQTYLGYETSSSNVSDGIWLSQGGGLKNTVKYTTSLDSGLTLPDESQWNTVALEYSSTTNERWVYVNGVKSAVTGTGTNRWYSEGKFMYKFYANLYAGEEIQLDYVKIYEKDDTAFVDETAPYDYNDFSSTLSTTTTTYPSTTEWYLQDKTATLATKTVNGDSVLSIAPSSDATTSSPALVRFYTPLVNPSAASKNLVFEFRVKFPATTGDQTYLGYETPSSNVSDGIWLSQGGGLKNTVKYTTSLDSGLTLPDESQWNTVALEYSSTTNERWVYVNGVKSAVTGTGTNRWYSEGKFMYKFYANLYAGEEIHLDYVKVYEYSDSFDCEVVNASATELNALTLNFNGSVVDLDASQISIDGVPVQSVTLLDGAANTYQVVPASTLKYGTDYALMLDGVKNATGGTIAAEYSFTTKAAPKHDVNVTITGNGTVTANGAAVTSGVPFEVTEGNKVLFVATPAEGYTVSSNLLVFNNHNEATLSNVTADTDVTITFTKSDANPSIQSVTTPYLDAANKASVSFARVTRGNPDIALVKYGVLVSTTANPTLADDTAFDLVSVANKNAYGEFGVKVTDDADHPLFADGVYYVTPYVEYGESSVAYGTSIAINYGE